MDALALGVLCQANDRPAGLVRMFGSVYLNMGRDVAVIRTVRRRGEIIRLVSLLALAREIAEIAVDRSTAIKLGPAEFDSKKFLHCASPNYRLMDLMLSAGFLRLEMPGLGEQAPVRATVDGCGPANDVRASTEQHEDLAVPAGSGPETAIDAPAACCARVQRRRRCGDPIHVLPVLLGCLLAGRPRFAPAQQRLPRQAGLIRWRFSDVDGPERPPNGEEILRITNLFVAKELGPGAVRGVAEVVGQFARRVPTAGGLR